MMLDRDVLRNNSKVEIAIERQIHVQNLYLCTTEEERDKEFERHSAALVGICDKYEFENNLITGKKVMVFNTDNIEFSGIYRSYEKELEIAHENFRENLCQCADPAERKAVAHGYLDDIVHIQTKYSGCSEEIDKETEMIIDVLCDMYGFTPKEVNSLKDFHNENDDRIADVFTITGPANEVSKNSSKELSLSR